MSLEASGGAEGLIKPSTDEKDTNNVCNTETDRKDVSSYGTFLGFEMLLKGMQNMISILGPTRVRG